MVVKRIHLLLGLLTVLFFLATGAYMRARFPDLYGDNETIRYLYRANHIYILCAGLLHLPSALFKGKST
jgi:hypothetical protein